MIFRDVAVVLTRVATNTSGTGLTLHELAFKPVIASQGSDEQQRQWLPQVRTILLAALSEHS